MRRISKLLAATGRKSDHDTENQRVNNIFDRSLKSKSDDLCILWDKNLLQHNYQLPEFIHKN